MTSLRYKTTRGENRGICFEEVVLQGLGAERGLYVPEFIPRFELLEIEQVGSNQLKIEFFLARLISQFM